jgi:hypothetical protein
MSRLAKIISQLREGKKIVVDDPIGGEELIYSFSNGDFWKERIDTIVGSYRYERKLSFHEFMEELEKISRFDLEASGFELDPEE